MIVETRLFSVYAELSAAVAAMAIFVLAIFCHAKSFDVNATKQELLLQKDSREKSTQQSRPLEIEGSRRRQLLGVADFHDPKSVALRKPFGSSDVHAISNIKERFYIPNLAPYGLNSIMLTPPAFTRELFLLYYDPIEDAFLIYIDEEKDQYLNAVYSPVFGRLRIVLPTLTFALRNHFSDRFQGAAGGSSEFIVFFSTGDIPKLTCDCVRTEERLKRPVFCQNEIFAPFIQFGSVYKDTTILPNAVTMPVWPQLHCFKKWQREGTVCDELILRSDVAGQLGGEEALSAAGRQMPFSVWDSLIPTIIWRGSDFFFLNCIHLNVPVDWDRDIATRLARFGNHAHGIIQALLQLWETLTPRWKAAALTAMAKLDADEREEAAKKDNGVDNERTQRQRPTPWIDAKFTVKSKVHAVQVEPKIDRYQPFREYGIPVSSEEKMSLSQLSKYKYHIDLAGGGGTTWFGTIEKLAMPGVLFHHVTSSKDYYHDDLIPWVHYIPVNEDLSNLREMFDWAEANPKDARRISEAATEYVKTRATDHVMKVTYERYFVHSLKRVVDAYQPLEGEKEMEQMKEWLSKWSFLAGKCNGWDDDCEMMNW
eukprot:CAMPEP_0172555542 /NCGR_PEP_ID=MMETSP1067-20121228/58472_1 /TAXON_ID=265564 ORGANISM="Thalassiosira punctigera, Strain Tpunct2005C2" /NCGR_SAMPLE_ID=MMETSP1067 /ASSEMBLY_ACC=CAM_ASM_000444 /LENGTH=594 /DNA_ID=CAMNT_0013344067 /DNA_START=115 /DNA_END=1896 /DNA_ORIENTATION=+